MPVSPQMCVLLNCCVRRAQCLNHTVVGDRDQPVEPNRTEQPGAHNKTLQKARKSRVEEEREICMYQGCDNFFFYVYYGFLDAGAQQVGDHTYLRADISISCLSC